jgi:hypothetical protein
LSVWRSLARFDKIEHPGSFPCSSIPTHTGSVEGVMDKLQVLTISAVYVDEGEFE